MTIAGEGAPTTRITRVRAAALHCFGKENCSSSSIGTTSQLPPTGRAGKKRPIQKNNQGAPVTAALQYKGRAVLKDVGNTRPGSSLHLDPNKRAKLPGGLAGDCKAGITTEVQDPTKVKAKEKTTTDILQNCSFTLTNVDNAPEVESKCETCWPSYCVVTRTSCNPKKSFIKTIQEGQGSTDDCKYINIDSDHKNPRLCCPYAPDIYTNLRVAELGRRPHSNFMETIQLDISPIMRGILIDWLVEVADEYNLLPDTLYLTVYIIDWFLSKNYIERQRLQLLGITSMVIASKYEQTCAPSIEKFCFITDNTYTREDVLKMEIQVLNYMNYYLCVPTAKTFLRRFIRAARILCTASTLVLEFLANYLTELTLVEYGFVSFLPSVIAASAVFLARWMMDQSSHPWSPTLEHCTCYKALDLKDTVMAMKDLQCNRANCHLNAIREKYKQPKFKSVANLRCQELLPSLFS